MLYSFRGWVQKRQLKELALLQGQSPPMGSTNQQGQVQTAPTTPGPNPQVKKVLKDLEGLTPNPSNPAYAKKVAQLVSGQFLGNNNQVLPTTQPAGINTPAAPQM